MNDKRDWTITAISWFSGILVLFLAVGGFVLSYQALKELSAANGLSDWRAYVWPLLIDAAIVVFTLAVLRAYVLSERSGWPWALVIVFTIGTIVFNLVHAGDNTRTLDLRIVQVDLKYLVGVVPPLAFVLSFETLMAMVRSSVQSRGLAKNVTVLQQELSRLKTDIQAETDKGEATLSRIEAKKQDVLNRLNAQIEARKEELKELERQPYNGAVTKENRQAIIPGLLAEGLEISQVAAHFDVSPKTIQRDLKELGIETNGSH